MATKDAHSRALKRDLGIFDSVGIGLGAIIGAGLFVVTGVAAGIAGPSFVAGLVIAGLAALCNALSSAQLAAAIPESGGTYEYGNRLLNPWFGFAAGWMFLVSKLAAAGVVALGFESSIRAFVPSLPEKIPALLTVAVLTGANLFGIKKAGRINSAIVCVTLLAVVYFIAGGIERFDSENLRPFAPAGIPGVLESAAILFFAYTGYARLATLGEEVRDPKKTIPRAIILALAIASILYVAAALVAVGAVGSGMMASSASPLVDAARTFTLPGAAAVTLVGASAAMLGVLLSQLLGISRMMLAMARRGDLPRPLMQVRESTGVPIGAVVMTGSTIGIVTVLGSIPWAVASASFAILLYYTITNVSALRQPEVDRLIPRWVSGAGLVFCVALALSLKSATIISGLIILSVGLAGRGAARRLAQNSG